ncbi:tetratricopeptide repeat protein [Sulfuritalea sp.]|uniref:tetratricopeptide repeat protein n=1 Tax=Sulfuritalea sp. TaxID=2480090 RepID=UPI00286D9502|nr:tetratricopeptide repeat protein [Sulfuritalea sp.]
MSLVNKMLRDLDARRAGNGERAALPAAVTPLAARQEPRGVRTPILLATVLLLAALGAWYAGSEQSAAPAVTTAVPAAPVPATLAAQTEPAAPAAPASLPANAPALAALSSLRMADQLAAAPATLPKTPPKTESKAPAIATSLPKPPPQAAAAAVAAKPVVKEPTEPMESRIDKQVRLPSAVERAEADYRRGLLAQRQGNADGAAGSYRAALENYPEHAAARQTLAAQLIDAKRFDEAEELLRKGAELPPVRLASTLALARLKVERNQAGAALDLLLKNAASGERSAEYQGFAGALLNRAGRTAEAVEHYRAATHLAPNEGRWWAGLGIALDAAGKGPDAREAYQKARALPGLPADLAQHIEQRLR